LAAAALRSLLLLLLRALLAPNCCGVMLLLLKPGNPTLVHHQQQHPDLLQPQQLLLTWLAHNQRAHLLLLHQSWPGARLTLQLLSLLLQAAALLLVQQQLPSPAHYPGLHQQQLSPSLADLALVLVGRTLAQAPALLLLLVVVRPRQVAAAAAPVRRPPMLLTLLLLVLQDPSLSGVGPAAAAARKATCLLGQGLTWAAHSPQHWAAQSLLAHLLLLLLLHGTQGAGHAR
jgi:hypothetical protein